MNAKKLLALCSAIVLTGQGCLGFGGGTSKAPDGGVFKSPDAGSTWIQAAAVPGPKGVGTIANANVLAIQMDPQDSHIVYLGTRENGLLYSEDGGTSWRQAREDALKTGRVDAVEVDPKQTCTVYVARGQRLYKTEDCLRTFDSEAYVETRTGVGIRQIELDWYNPNTVWLALSNGDVLKSLDGGKTWRTSLSAKDDALAMIVSAKDSRQVLVGTAANGFFRTIDGGDTWTQIEKELASLRNAKNVFALAQTADAGVVIAATKYGLIRSKDFGAGWEGIALLSAPGQLTIKAVAVAPADANTIYYAALSTFYVSKDGGVTWKTAKIPSARIPEAMRIDPKAPESVYLGVSAPEKK